MQKGFLIIFSFLFGHSDLIYFADIISQNLYVQFNIDCRNNKFKEELITMVKTSCSMEFIANYVVNCLEVRAITDKLQIKCIVLQELQLLYKRRSEHYSRMAFEAQSSIVKTEVEILNDLVCKKHTNN